MIVADILTQLRSDGRSVLAATHDLDRLEHKFDDVILLREGTATPLGELACPT